MDNDTLDIVGQYGGWLMTAWVVFQADMRIFKAIAVNNDLVYDVTKCKNSISNECAVIFANSRLVPTSDILKPIYRYGQIKGMLNSMSRCIEQY